MLLAIDIGNTNTVFAVYDGGGVMDSWRLQTLRGRSADEYAAFLQPLFAHKDISFNGIKAVIVSSVVPDANRAMRVFCEQYIGQQSVFVSKDMVGVAADIERPEDIGADRLVNAVAVNAKYNVPAIVVDFGTATTFDVIDAQGHYAGGVIAPGVNLSVAALHQAASKLPQISVKKPQKALGKNTVSAMQSGVYWGYVGLIERILGELKQEISGDVQVIATGGLAPLFAEDNDMIDVVDQDLTIEGLCLIAKEQKLI